MIRKFRDDDDKEDTFLMTVLGAVGVRNESLPGMLSTENAIDVAAAKERTALLKYIDCKMTEVLD